jgi:hypothetical protein
MQALSFSQLRRILDVRSDNIGQHLFPNWSRPSNKLIPKHAAVNFKLTAGLAALRRRDGQVAATTAATREPARYISARASRVRRFRFK